jgi:hypothetical protein
MTHEMHARMLTKQCMHARKLTMQNNACTYAYKTIQMHARMLTKAVDDDVWEKFGISAKFSLAIAWARSFVARKQLQDRAIGMLSGPHNIFPQTCLRQE